MWDVSGRFKIRAYEKEFKNAGNSGMNVRNIALKVYGRSS